MILCTYYRRFISGFAYIVKPLTNLTEENQAFQWTMEAEATFYTPKEAVELPLFWLTSSHERGSSLRQTRGALGL
jgi:hypothetical protein